MSAARAIRRSHRRPGFLAALAHRLSGLALMLFLPLHFLALGTAIRGADSLDDFLVLTDTPAIKFLEWGLVTALAFHLACGLRLLAIEFLPARERTAAAVAACFGVALAAGLAFLLGLGRGA